MRQNIMRQFKTKNFIVQALIEPDSDLDLSWDDTGEVREKLDSGEYEAFQTEVRVLFRGAEIAADYLGGSIYAEPRDFFKEHVGARGRYGSYFRDMVGRAIKEAREQLSHMPRIRAA